MAEEKTPLELAKERIEKKIADMKKLAQDSQVEINRLKEEKANK